MYDFDLDGVFSKVVSRDVVKKNKAMKNDKSVITGEREHENAVDPLSILGYIRTIHGRAFIIPWYDAINSIFPVMK